MLIPRSVVLIGTLSSVLTNVVNLVISTACALAAKITILLMYLHPGGEEIAGRIAKAHRIDNRYGPAVHFRAVDAKHFGQLTRLAPVEKHRAGIGLDVNEPTSSRNRLGKRHPPGGRRAS